MKWTKLFKNYILDRGYDYYETEQVRNMEATDTHISAIVDGFDTYEVNVDLCNEEVVAISCTCPYAEDGNNCKHMAAVLYQWEGERSPVNETTSTTEKVHENNQKVQVMSEAVTQKYNDDIERLFHLATDDQIKSFLIQVLTNDPKLRSDFKDMVLPKLSKDMMKDYKKSVDVTIRHYLGRDHFISYYEARDFFGDMEDFLDTDVRALIETGYYWESFELSSYIFVKVGNIDIDDSDGGTTFFAMHCLDIWNEILDLAESKTETKMFRWIMKQLDGPMVDYMKDHLESILMERFMDETFLLEKLDFTERRVLEAQSSQYEWTRRYETGRWALHHLRIMEELGQSWESIETYCKSNWASSDVRKYYVDACLRRRDREGAIRVLKESMELDREYPGLVSDYAVRLKVIFQRMGDQERYRQQLWEIILNYIPGDLETYRELKALYAPEVWSDEREKVFAKLGKTSNRIAPLCREDKLYDRLLEYVLSIKGLHPLLEYEKDLRDVYPLELLQKFETEMDELVRRTADRKTYREWMRTLQRMLKIDGGQKKVNEITTRWKHEYKHRPAMMDEMDKVFKK